MYYLYEHVYTNVFICILVYVWVCACIHTQLQTCIDNQCVVCFCSTTCMRLHTTTRLPIYNVTTYYPPLQAGYKTICVYVGSYTNWIVTYAIFTFAFGWLLVVTSFMFWKQQHRTPLNILEEERKKFDENGLFDLFLPLAYSNKVHLSGIWKSVAWLLILVQGRT